MSIMAEETVNAKKRLSEGEKMTDLLDKRLEELREENNALRQTNMGKDSEIRHLNDQISELFMQLRLHEKNQIGLLDQLRNQTESEAIVVNAQKEHSSTLTNLSDKYNKLLAENEDLRMKVLTQKKDIEAEVAQREDTLKVEKRKFDEELELYVSVGKYKDLEKQYNELLAKHRKLMKLQISSTLGGNDSSNAKDSEFFEAGAQLEYLAAQIAKLRTIQN